MGPAKATSADGSKVKVLHAGYNRTLPKCWVQFAQEEKNIVEDEAERSESTETDKQ